MLHISCMFVVIASLCIILRGDVNVGLLLMSLSVFHLFSLLFSFLVMYSYFCLSTCLFMIALWFLYSLQSSSCWVCLALLCISFSFFLASLVSLFI